jgi:hypothetical protein
LILEIEEELREQEEKRDSRMWPKIDSAENISLAKLNE